MADVDEDDVISFWGKFRKTETGIIDIVSGHSEQITVRLHFTPSKVELAFTAEDTSTPVCVGNHDWFDVKIIPNGFILLAQLTSNSRQIEWKATK
jgi:hypothetical protein